MKRAQLLWIAVGTAALFLAGFVGWIFRLPAQKAVVAPPAITEAEHQAMLSGLQPPKRTRPLVAIVGINDATETTDYLLPYGILKRANVADVMLLSTEPGPVNLYPALQVEPEATITQFDQQYPEGADYVIVPAMDPHDDETIRQWLGSQADKDAIIIGVCVGATVVGATGLLEDRRATTHWYSREQLLEETPTATYVPDRRFVIDGKVVTTTGISASMPMMLTLIEAIAGRDKAASVAAELGVEHWDARHDSDAFTLTRPFATTVLANKLSFWNRQDIGIELKDGVDEIALAFAADAWSRTYRSRAVTFSDSDEPVLTRSGLRLIPERVAAQWPRGQRIAAFAGKPSDVLDQTLAAIAAQYGNATGNIVAMQLEYPWPKRP